MKKLPLSDLVIPVLLSLVVLLTSSLIAKAQDQLTFPQIAKGALIIGVVFFILAGMVLAFQGRMHKSELEVVVGQLRQLVPPSAPSDYPWLYSDAELAKAESEAKGDSIWIISPDLINVTEKAIIRDAVKKNIKRRITYTYIVPDSFEIDGVLLGLEQLFNSNPKQLNLVRIPAEQFRTLSVTHIAILNVGRADEMASEAFLELPIADASGNKIPNYWIKVSRDATSGLIGRFRKVIENSKSQKSGIRSVTRQPHQF